MTDLRSRSRIWLNGSAGPWSAWVASTRPSIAAAGAGSAPVPVGGGVGTVGGAPAWVTTPSNNRMLFLGDSRANVGTTNTATNIQFKTLGLPTWVGLMMGQRIDIVAKDYGTGGATISNVLNNTGPVPGSYNKSLEEIFQTEDASTIHILWGVNQWTLTADNSGACAAALAQAKSDTLAAIALAYTYNRRIMISDHPADLANPVTAVTTGMSALRQQLGSDYDDWLATLPGQYPWFFYTGQYRALAASASGPTISIANTLYDGKHSLSKGASLSAQAMVPTLTTLFPTATPVFTLATNANQTGQKITNGQFAGTPGSAPTGWTLSTASGITAAWTYGTAPNGENEAILTLSGSTSTAFIQMNRTLDAFAAGVQLRASVDIAVDSGHTGLVAVGTPEFNLIDGSAVNTKVQDFNSGGATFNSGGTFNPLDGLAVSGQRLTPLTPVLQVSTAYTTKQMRYYVYFQPSATVAAVIRFRQGTVR